LTQAKNKAQKSKKVPGSVSSEESHEHHAFDQELVNKIEENIQLHKKVDLIIAIIYPWKMFIVHVSFRFRMILDITNGGIPQDRNGRIQISNEFEV